MKIPKYVILIYPDGELKHYIDSDMDLEAVKIIASNLDYRIKYPPKGEWKEICI